MCVGGFIEDGKGKEMRKGLLCKGEVVWEGARVLEVELGVHTLDAD